MNRRGEIAMSAEEIAAFLGRHRTLICATNGRGGWPHVMPLWFLARDDDLWVWTFAKSQKVRNLERDPRATLQVEAGEQYHELRGVMIEAQTEIHEDPELVVDFGMELLTRFSAGVGQGQPFREAILEQAVNRVVLQFKPERVVSFDHRKLVRG